MAEITHEHLTELAERLEGSTRREIDTLRAEVAKDFRGVHHRIDELKHQVSAQNSRIGKSEDRIGDLKANLSSLRGAPVVPSRPKDDVEAGTDPPYVTRRDIRVAVFVVSGVFALFQVLERLGPMLAKAVQP